MQVSDSPHAAGTPEHSEWVRRVFIPAVSRQRADIDRVRVGAESIGGKLIRGSDQRLVSAAAGADKAGVALRCAGVATELASNSMALFFEEWVGLAKVVAEPRFVDIQVC